MATGHDGTDDANRIRAVDATGKPDHRVMFGKFQQSASTDTTVMTTATVILAILASCTILYLASSLLVPVTVSCLAYLTLRPFVCKLCKRGLSQTVASGIVIVTLLGINAAIIGVLYQPLQHWIEAAPEGVAKFRSNIDALRQPLTTIDDAEQKLSNASAEASSEPQAVEVFVQKPGIVSETVLFNSTGRLLAFFSAIAMLTFFLLSTGDDLINRALHVLPSDEKRQEALELIGGIQNSVGSYFGQITMINFALGIVVTGVMWLVGMPTPLLWGVLAMLFNFIPYVGAVAAASLVFMAALSTFDSAFRAAFTAFAFWSCTALEGQFVTPTILGKTLKVGPVVVLVAVAFWGFLWGLSGVFIAVPLLMVQRQVLAQFKPTFPLAVILGEKPKDAVKSSEAKLEDDKSIQAAAV